MFNTKLALTISLFLCYNLYADEMHMRISGKTCESNSQQTNEELKSNFAVIYRGYLKPGREGDYQNAWQSVAQYFIKYRGAIIFLFQINHYLVPLPLYKTSKLFYDPDNVVTIHDDTLTNS